MNLASQDLDLFWLTDASSSHVSISRPGVPLYRVGEPLLCGRQSWPTGAQYHHAANGHELTIFQSDIDEDMIQEVQRGHMEFAVVVKHPIILLAYRFGATGAWSDVPYCWHMQPQHLRLVPPQITSDESRALLWITLVGANDGVIHAQRGVTLAPSFTQTLHEAISRQARMPFQATRCIMTLNTLLTTYPSVQDRLPLACSHTVANQ